VAQEKLNVRFRNLLAAQILGFTVSALFPGRLGELAKPIYLARKEGIRTGFAVGTTVVERLFDAVILCLLLGLFSCTALFASSWPSEKKAGERLTLLGISGVILAAGLLAIILAFISQGAGSARRRLLLQALPKARATVERLLGEFIDGSSSSVGPAGRPLRGALARRLAGHRLLLLGFLPRLSRPRALLPRHSLCLPDGHRRLHPTPAWSGASTISASWAWSPSPVSRPPGRPA